MLDNTEEENTVEIEDQDTDSDVSWNNPPTITDLKNDYQSAKVIHQNQVNKINTWLDNLNITGSAQPAKVPGRSSIVPKLIRKQAEWRYSSLSEPFLSTDDVFNIDPVTYEDKESAIQNALVLNNQFNTKINKISFIDEYVRTAVDEGTVIVRVGWEEEEEEFEEERTIYEYAPTNEPAVVNLHDQIHQQMQADPSVFDTLPPELQEAHQLTMEDGVAYAPVEVGVEVVKEVRVSKNQPTVEVCDYNNIVIDPTAKGDLEKARFVIYSFETSLSELEKSGKYKNLDKVMVSNSSVLSDPDHVSDEETEVFNFSDKPRKRLVAYEYWGGWDIDKTGIVKPIVATWIGNVFIQMEENPFPDKKHPFVSAQYLPVRKSIYGEPDGELLEDNQKIIGAVTRGMIDLMGRSANGQTGVRKDALDTTNKRKYEKGLDYEFNGNVTPDQAFYMHSYPEIPRAAEYMLNLQNAEAESLTGVKAFHSGITGDALGSSVGGQRNALDATSKRELGILRRLAEGVKQIGRKIIAMNAEFLSEEEVIRITEDEFVTVRRDDLAGNFDLKLTISTAEADNDKAQELSFMLQTMGNTIGLEFSQILLADIARLRKMPALAKKIENFKPQPDPLAIKEAELRVQLLEAQVANERAKAQENATDIGLKQAKTATEQAKARNIHSISDKTDLDFLEQQSSVTHDREVDKLVTKGKSELDKLAAQALISEANNNTI